MKKLTRWIPLLLWMTVIFYMSGRTKAEVPSFGTWDLLVKKGSHFLAYGFFALLAWWAVRGWKRPFLSTFTLTLLYAASDEIHQTFVPTRHGQPTDVLIDILGGLTMLLILYYWLGRKKSREVEPLTGQG